MRYKLTIEYDGTNLVGWQRQDDGPSVQEYLETALSFFRGAPQTFSDSHNNQLSYFTRYGKVPDIQFFCAGRTDAGVHATGQVAHFDIPETIDTFRIREALNFHLRNNNIPVSVLSIETVDENFHARFSAQGRKYLYRIINRRSPLILEKNRAWWVPVPLDVEKMRQAAQDLLGFHDFTSFRASACQAKSPLKTLDKLSIETHHDEIDFLVEARSFLHHQVRNMVGTLKMVGDGHFQVEDIHKILEAKDRKQAGPTAPAEGLYLTEVVY